MKTTTNKMDSIGKRKPYTIYVDKRVWRQFKPLAQKMFKNVSRALEAYMLSEVLKDGEGK